MGWPACTGQGGEGEARLGGAELMAWASWAGAPETRVLQRSGAKAAGQSAHCLAGSPRAPIFHSSLNRVCTPLVAGMLLRRSERPDWRFGDFGELESAGGRGRVPDSFCQFRRVRAGGLRGSSR